MAVNIALTGVLFVCLALALAGFFDESNVPIAFQGAVVAMFFGGVVAVMAGALVAIWA